MGDWFNVMKNNMIIAKYSKLLTLLGTMLGEHIVTPGHGMTSGLSGRVSAMNALPDASYMWTIC